jgi:S1-C subfamily serine protease
MKYRNLLAIGLAGLFGGSSVGMSGCATLQRQAGDKYLEERTESLDLFDNSIPVSQSEIAEFMASVVKIEIGGNYINNITGLEEKLTIGSGSGIVLPRKDDTYRVFTAKHVVDGNIPESIWGVYTLNSDMLISVNGVEGAEVVVKGYENFDYAVLEVPIAPNLVPYEGFIADARDIRQGDIVCSAGYSLGLDDNFDCGTISNTVFPRMDRNSGKVVLDGKGFMNSSGISPGNSGGPLAVVSQGQLILAGITLGYYPQGQEYYIATSASHAATDAKKNKVDIGLESFTKKKAIKRKRKLERKRQRKGIK